MLGSNSSYFWSQLATNSLCILESAFTLSGLGFPSIEKEGTRFNTVEPKDQKGMSKGTQLVT